jgi:acyloxyacyl hydrolase
MKGSHFALTILLVASALSVNVNADNKDCMWCTMVVRTLERFIEYNEGTVEQKLVKYCDLFDTRIASLCKLIIQVEGKPLLELLMSKQNPDVVCQEIGLCKLKECLLYPKSSYVYKRNSNDDPWWKKILDQLFDKLISRKPLVDFDGDGYSIVQATRGTLWRGKDCSDANIKIHPGRKLSDFDPSVDHNCNGIAGTNGTVSYELMLCGGTMNRGVAVLGDSGSAHFRISERLFDPVYMNKEHYQWILSIAENEVDWPQLSWVTGFYDKDITGLTPGPIDSIYKRMLQRNKCIHRDFQNLAVNGASSSNILEYMKNLSRNQTTDNPLLLFIALIGNDVCGEAPGFDRMTTPEKFYTNIKQALDYLSTKLPPNSYIVFMGLATGNYLYEILQNQTHPLGVTYEQLYRWQNCLAVAPCWGWMSLNQTVRDLTTKRAQELSAVYPKLINDLSGNYKNFKMLYHDFPFKEIAEQYRKEGKSLIELIEPFDGFHPSQILQSLMAKYMWEWLEREHPDALESVNVHNHMIEKLFGDQGGY